MKAFSRRRFGSPDLLLLDEIDKPSVGEDQALIRVHASSINAHDWHMLRGKPYLARLSEGLRTPKTREIGLDVAGVVEEVGSAVAHVKPGDRVFGSRFGAFAEYVSGKNMVPMPDGLSFEQAAAVPTAGQTALQALRDHGQLRAGQHVLVNGAGGGVGTFAVQIAKALGADVTAVTGTTNVGLMRSIGADDVLDYSRDDFTRGEKRYDVIVDIGGTPSLSRIRRVLRPNGRLVMVAPQPGQWIGPVVRMGGAMLLSRLGGQTLKGFLATVNREDLMALKELIEAGKVTPVIDRSYPFDQIPDAIRYVESGKSHGKVTITFPG